ncbi:hypothetical protein A4X13_0g7766 [Tilletia indica]|uniref:DUF4218 domain-containing protein n=1 Tax=Tilletia indica TaxID=43049 RepID=A0A177TI26_9BASI|nr:hypothetical protein A4X13_0g7766 [Tilletia indica]
MPQPLLERTTICYCSKCGSDGHAVMRSTRQRHELDDVDPALHRSPSPDWVGMDGDADDGLEHDEGFLGEGTEGFGFDAGVDFGIDLEPQDFDDGPPVKVDSGIDVDDDLVPTLSQLRSQWMASDTAGSAPRPDGLWLFELLLVWLNATFGITEHVCALLLTFVEAIFANTSQSSDWLPVGHSKPRISARLRRVRQSLWQGSVSVCYALCPATTCWNPHLLDSSTPATCSRCDERLFRDGNDSSDEDAVLVLPVPQSREQPAAPSASAATTRRSRPVPGRSRPRLSLHYEPIASWLIELARRDNFFDLFDEWRSREPTPGIYGDIYDGSSWVGDALVQAGSYAGLTLMIDSVQPFSRSGSVPYSCCVISLRIDNLPRQIRNLPDWTHICCILPGPKKPKTEALHSVLHIIIAELRRLSTTGLEVFDSDGKSHHLRAHLRCLIADTEARTSVAGFPHHSSKDQFCPWCDADGNTWVRNHIEGTPFEFRTVGDHRRDSLAALRDSLNLPSAEDILLLRRAAAAGPCALYKLDGWSSLTMAPVDVMHALDLGLCKHFWTETLTAGGLLKGPDLKRCQKLLSTIKYPTGVTKVSVTLGDTGGGSPTAHGWSVLSRYILPLMLALSWSDVDETEKRFSSKKRTVTGRRQAKGKKGKGKVRHKPPSVSSSSSDDDGSITSDDDADELAGPSSSPRKRKRIAKSRKTTRTFSTMVSLKRLVEASLHLAHATRLGHAFILSEAQLDKLHSHLSDFVKIIATDLHPKWTSYNYHIVLHIADQIRLHGPPRTYWAYPSERLYGLMKQVKTNRHRNGEIEFSLLSRTDDRHRVATVVSNLPPNPLAIALRTLIEGEQQHGAQIADELNPLSATSSRTKSFQLSSIQAEAVCELANKKRPADSDPLVSLSLSTAGKRENVINHTATRIDRLKVKNTVLAPKSTSSSPSSDPGACIVQVGTEKRMARYKSAFRHSFFEESAGKMVTYTYAEVQVHDNLPWPDHDLFSDSMWTELGYIMSDGSQHRTLVLNSEDIVCAALTVDASPWDQAEQKALFAIPV